MNRLVIITCLLFTTQLQNVIAQENVGPLRYNAALSRNKTTRKNTGRTSSVPPLTLPFFEDFAQYSPYPDSTKWVDFEVYINNTMGASPISRGVATFDDLNMNGIPYDSFNNADFEYADSLTSQPIDMSSYSPADSVYLSFFYQPQGNGFYPLPGDSLMLFLKTVYGGYQKVWAVPGTTLQPFQQVMIPITDSFYFDSSFQFRFVNIAALDWSDAVWNIDYIRLDKNRFALDTTIEDVTFTSDPTFLLNDYTSMPWSQYVSNPLSETASQVNDSIRNTSILSQNVNYLFSIHDVTGGVGTSLFTGGSAPLSLPDYQTLSAPESFSIPSTPPYPANTVVDFESQYYIQQTGSLGPTDNDTIVKHQVFDNYLAYDDGTAEKSYYLNLFSTLPGKIAIEFHLNHPDTLRGLAIYFGRQVPLAYTNKLFSIIVYSALQGVNGASSDNLLREQDEYIPYYVDTVNHFWNYILDTPLVLPAGIFYAGSMQCAECGDDSLYYGLDVNRIGSNHAYYNVLGSWSQSLISGAIMIRPILGQQISGTGVSDIALKKTDWQVMPNPAKDILQVQYEGTEQASYQVTDIAGHTIMHGSISSGGSIDISQLAPGMYFANLITNGILNIPKKIVKL